MRPFEHSPIVETPSILVWYLKPNAVYSWIPPDGHLSLPDVTVLTETLSYSAVKSKLGDSPYRFIHDFVNIRKLDKDVRQHMVNWGKTFPKEDIEFMRIRILKSHSLLPYLAASTATVALSLIGYDIKIVENFTAELEGCIPFAE